ncbi:MAG: PEGA domain-containing protein [Methanoregula sp.]
MKRFTHIICYFLLFTLLIIAVPVATASPTITTISPKVGYTDSYTTVTITGSNFNTTSGEVKLKMAGTSNITSTISSWSDTQIICKLKTSGQKTGVWDLVVINADESEKVKVEAFTLKDPMVLTSISPTEARVNTENVDVTVKGTGLADVSELYLYNEDYNNITADLGIVNSGKITGTFDLSGTDKGTYDVCVKDSDGGTECDLAFTIITDAVGSIYFDSNPTGATVYLNKTSVGTTTFTYYNATEGSYQVLIQKTGYKDYSDSVTVKEGKRTTFYARLTPLSQDTTVAATAATTKQVKTTATTVKKSTLNVPTTYPSATPTEKSPVDPAVIVGSICLAFLALRKH